MDERLRFCPFCGGEARAFSRYHSGYLCPEYSEKDNGDGTVTLTLVNEGKHAIIEHHKIVCTKCGAQTADFDEMQRAVEKWNERKYPYGACEGCQTYTLYHQTYPYEFWELGENEVTQVCDIGFSTEPGGFDEAGWMDKFEDVGKRHGYDYICFFDKKAALKMQLELNEGILFGRENENQT